MLTDPFLAFWLALWLTPFWALPIVAINWRRFACCVLIWLGYLAVAYGMMRWAAANPKPSQFLNEAALLWFVLGLAGAISGIVGLVTQAIVMWQKWRGAVAIRTASYAVMNGGIFLWMNR